MKQQTTLTNAKNCILNFNLKKYFLIMLFLVFNFSLFAQKTYVWTGAGGDNNWTNSQNWTPNGIPNSIDNVTIGTPSNPNTGIVTLNVEENEYSVNNFTMVGGTLDLNDKILNVFGNAILGDQRPLIYIETTIGTIEDLNSVINFDDNNVEIQNDIHLEDTKFYAEVKAKGKLLSNYKNEFFKKCSLEHNFINVQVINNGSIFHEETWITNSANKYLSYSNYSAIHDIFKKDVHFSIFKYKDYKFTIGDKVINTDPNYFGNEYHGNIYVKTDLNSTTQHIYFQGGILYGNIIFEDNDEDVINDFNGTLSLVNFTINHNIVLDNSNGNGLINIYTNTNIDGNLIIKSHGTIDINNSTFNGITNITSNSLYLLNNSFTKETTIETYEGGLQTTNNTFNSKVSFSNMIYTTNTYCISIGTPDTFNDEVEIIDRGGTSQNIRIGNCFNKPVYFNKKVSLKSFVPSVIKFGRVDAQASSYFNEGAYFELTEIYNGTTLMLFNFHQKGNAFPFAINNENLTLYLGSNDAYPTGCSFDAPINFKVYEIKNNGQTTFGNNITIDSKIDLVPFFNCIINANSEINSNKSLTMNNLTIENGAEVILNTDALFQGSLNLKGNNGGGNLYLNKMLTLGYKNSTNIYPTISGDINNFIHMSPTASIFHQYYSVASGFPATTPFTYPIGDATNYTPCAITYNNPPTYAAGCGIKIKVINGLEPNLVCKKNYLNRYWDIEAVKLTPPFKADLSFEFVETDKIFTETISSDNLFPLRWNFENGLKKIGGNIDLSTNRMELTGVTEFGHFTADKSEEHQIYSAEFSNTVSQCSNNAIHFNSLNPLDQLGTHTWNFGDNSSLTGSFISDKNVNPVHEYNSTLNSNLFKVQHTVSTTCNEMYISKDVNVNFLNPVKDATAINNDVDFTIYPSTEIISNQIDLSICNGKTNVIFIIDNKLNLTQIDRLTFTMPYGVKYVGGSFRVNDNLQQDNTGTTAIYSQPYFENIELQSGINKISFEVEACCILTGTDKEIHAKIDYTKATEKLFVSTENSTESKPITILNINKPNVYIDQTTVKIYKENGVALGASEKVNLGTTLYRKFVVTNDGTAPVSEFSLIDKHDNSLTLQSATMQVSTGETKEVVVNDNGNINFNFDGINSIQKLSVGTSVTIVEKIMVTCASVSSSKSNLSVEWGCSPEDCSKTFANPIESTILINAGTPTVNLLDNVENVKCFGTEGVDYEKHILKISAPIITKLKTITFKKDNRSYSHIQNDNPLKYTIIRQNQPSIPDQNCTVVGVVKTSSLNNECVGNSSEIVEITYQFDNIPTLYNNDIVELVWYTTSCQPNEDLIANNTFYPYDFNISVTFSDYCDENKIYSSTPFPVKPLYSSMKVMKEGPTDLVGEWGTLVEETGTYHFTCSNLNLWQESIYRTGGYLEVTLNTEVPDPSNPTVATDGLIVGTTRPNTGVVAQDILKPLILVLNNKTTLEPDNYFYRDKKIITARFPLDKIIVKNNNLLLNGEIQLQMTADCPTDAAKSFFNLHVNYIPDATCTNNPIALLDQTLSVNVHCPGCDKPGIHALNFKINRTTVGKPDVDAPFGIPESGDVDLSTIRTDRVMAGDELEGVFNTAVILNGTGNIIGGPYNEDFFKYGYCGITRVIANDQLKDIDLQLLNIDVLITRTIGGVEYKYNFYIPYNNDLISTYHPNDYYYLFDYSVDVLKTSNCTSGNLQDFIDNFNHFATGDRIVFKTHYKLNTNVKLTDGKLNLIELVNHAYLGVNPRPNFDEGNFTPNLKDPIESDNRMFYCTMFADDFTVLGFDQISGTKSTPVNACEKIIDNYTNFYIYSTNSGFNPFPNEFRNFGNVSSQKIQYLDARFDVKDVEIYAKSLFYKDLTEAKSSVLGNTTTNIISLNNQKTLVIVTPTTPIPQGTFTDGGLLQSGSFTSGFRTYITADCSDAGANLNFPYNGNIGFSCANLVTSGAKQEFSDLKGLMNFTAPKLVIKASKPNASDNIVNIPITIENIESTEAKNVWVNFSSFENIKVEKIIIDGITSTISDQNTYINIGSIKGNNYRTITAIARYECPDKPTDTEYILTTNAVWTCDNVTPSKECGENNKVSFNISITPDNAGLNTSITNKDDFKTGINLGTPFSVKYEVSANSSGSVKKLLISLNSGSFILEDAKLNGNSIGNQPENGWNIFSILGLEKLSSVDSPLSFEFIFTACGGNTSNSEINITPIAYSNCGKIEALPSFLTVTPIINGVSASSEKANIALTQTNSFSCADESVDINLSVNFATSYVPTLNDWVEISIPNSFKLDDMYSLISNGGNIAKYKISGPSFPNSLTLTRVNNTQCDGNITAEVFIGSSANCNGNNVIVGGSAGKTVMKIETFTPTINSINSNISTICSDSEVTFTAATNCNTAEKYIWNLVSADNNKSKLLDSKSNPLVYKFNSGDISTYNRLTLQIVKNGCVSETFYYSLNFSTLNVTITSSYSVCSGSNVLLNATSSLSGTSFSWYPTTGLSSSTVPNPSAKPEQTTTYSVTASKNGCSVSKETIVTVKPTPSIEIISISDNEICKEVPAVPIILELKGSYSTLTCSGATKIDGNFITVNPTIIPKTTYTIVGKFSDGNTCTSSTVAEILVNPKPTITFDKQNISCFGLTNGVLTANVNTAGPYEFTWNNGSLNNKIENLSTGLYQVTVKDGKGCINSNSATITQPSALIASISAQLNVSCNGLSDGTATVSATGGTGNYSYLWNDVTAQTSQTATGLTAGDYSVLVKDANLCSTSANVTITQPDAISISSSDILVNNVTTIGGNDGSISIKNPENYIGFEYKIDVVGSNYKSISEPITGLAKGYYNLIIKKGNCTSIIENVIVDEPKELTVILENQINVDCFGNETGQIVVSASNGIAPYQYSIDNNNWQNTGVFPGLVAGSYTIYTRDVNLIPGIIENIQIIQPSAQLEVACTATEIKCNGKTTNIDVSVLGGTPGYTYNWSGGQTTEDLLNITAGNYSVTVTDENLCTATTSITITEPQILTVEIKSTTEYICSGSNSGKLTANILGGTEPYQINWSNGMSGSLIENLNSGIYEVTVIDVNNCEALNTFEIKSVTPPDAEFIINNKHSEICVSEEVEFISVESQFSHTWEVFDINNNLFASFNDNNTGLKYSFEKPGDYNVVHTIVKNENGISCSNEYTDLVRIANCCAIIYQEPLFVNEDLTINEDKFWSGKVFVREGVNITVDNNATLDITNVDVVFENCAGINVINGSINANNSVFRTCSSDDVWDGIVFNNNSSEVKLSNFSECTFKNAMSAIRTENLDNSTLRITNNLFENNKYGLYINNEIFENSITGNTYIVNDNLPNYSALNCNLGTTDYNFGIFAENVNFKDALLSQNDFIYPDDDSNVKFTAIEFANVKNSNIVSNNFTNVFRAINIRYSENIKVETNILELSSAYYGDEHQISSSNSTNILVNSNKVSSTSAQVNAITNSAIYSENDNNIDITNNEIKGFETAIQLTNLTNGLISENIISNVYTYGIYNSGGTSNEISCNQIDFDNIISATEATGIYCIENIGLDYIHSNCITNPKNAMFLDNFEAVIRNNYFYNFSKTGIKIGTYSSKIISKVLDIGKKVKDSEFPGGNSFIANNGSQTTYGIYKERTNQRFSVFGNYGIFNPKNVSVSGNSINSTAKCGNQIGSNVNNSLSKIYSCGESKIYVVNVNNGILSLKSNYQDIIKDENYTIGTSILNALSINNDENLLNDFYNNSLNLLKFNENEKQWYSYHYNRIIGNFNEASNILNIIKSIDENESDLISIEKIDLTLKMENRNCKDLKEQEISLLSEIFQKDSLYSHTANSILAAAHNDVEYAYSKVNYLEPLSSEEINKNKEDLFKVYPNPTNSSVSVEYSIENYSNVYLNILDVTGKTIKHIQIEENTNFTTLDLTQLTEGIYLLEIISDKTILHYQKIVKMSSN